MNKLTFIILALIAILVLGIGATLYTQNNTTPQSNQTDIVSPTQTDTSISIPTQQEIVVLDNFLKNPDVHEDEYNRGYYFLGNVPPVSAGSAVPPYVITYQAATGFINIGLMKKPFAVSQYQAETYLKNLLKIPDNELCILPYSVSVPGYVDDIASGIDYRFSFCADSLTLPNN